MKKIIFAFMFLVGMWGQGAAAQSQQVVEEYHIPIFSAKTYMGDTNLIHLAFPFGPVQDVFDSLRTNNYIIPGNNYDLVFEKVRIYDSIGVFQKTVVRFKHCVVKQLPAVDDCIYQVSCYTAYRGFKLKPYIVLGQFENDSLVFNRVCEYFFDKYLEYGMQYTITISDSYSTETGERIVYIVSEKKDLYIQTIRNITGQ